MQIQRGSVVSGLPDVSKWPSACSGKRITASIMMEHSEPQRACPTLIRIGAGSCGRASTSAQSWADSTSEERSTSGVTSAPVAILEILFSLGDGGGDYVTDTWYLVNE
jgi:hypothetical protein